MAPPKQKAASYELIETGGGEGYGSVEPASADSANEEYDKYDGGETPRRKLLSLVAPASATGKFLFVLCIVLVVASRLCTLAAPLALSRAIDGLEVASPEVVTLILVYDLPPGAGGGRAGRGAPRGGGVSYILPWPSLAAVKYVCGRVWVSPRPVC